MVIGFVIAGGLAWWLQDVILPYSTPFWGLFDYQLDLDVYRQGAQTVLDGGSLYDAKLLGQMDYTYTPISTVMFMPFAAMSFAAARIVWTVGILLALYLTIMVSFRSLGHETTWRLRVVAMSLVSVMMLMEPVRTTIWYGQINVFLMLLIIADLARRSSPSGRSRMRRTVPLGLPTGIAAGIKLTPLLFVVYLAAVRKWRAAGAVLVGFAATIVVGAVVLPRESWSYWTDKLFDANRVGAPQTVGNQSARGALANLIGSDHPNVVLWLAVAGAAFVIGLYAAVLAHRHGRELLAISLLGMTSCVVSPVSWGHHWVWFVPLVIIAIDLVADASRPAIQRMLVAAGLLAGFLTVFAWRTHFAFGMWFVNQSVPQAYLVGLFFKNGIRWLRWFTYDPYNWVFLAVAVTTIVVLRGRGVRFGESAPKVPTA